CGSHRGAAAPVAPRPGQPASALGLAVVGPEAARRPWAVRGALTARLRAAVRSAHRLRQVAVRHSAPECPAACRCAAVTAAYPLRRWAVLPETERQRAALDSAARRRAGSAIPKVL